MKKQNNRSGSMLALVAIGILAVGGIVPFLIENTETNQKLTNSIDETNKQIWTLQSAVHNASHKSSQNVLGLKEVTTREINEPVLDFYYGDKEKGFKSEAQVTCVNAYLNKNQVFVGNIHDKDGYDLSSIKYSEVKPGTTVINNTTYVWDKYGKLYELENNKLVQKTVPGKVWQLVSDGVNPVVLTDDFKAVNLKDNKEYGNNYYQFASKSDDFQAAIQNDDRLAIPRNNAVADKFNEETDVNAKVEDLALSSNHGLVLVKSNDNWQVWGWGNNEKSQLICTDKDAEDKDKKTAYTELVKISDIFSQCKASGNVIADAVIPIQEYRRNGMSSAENYFMQHYEYTLNPNGTYTITNNSTDKSGVHNPNINQEKCDCPFCQDVFAPYTGLELEFPSIQMHLPEDQVVKRIECYINDDGTGDMEQPLQFQILNEAGDTIHTFKKSLLNTALGQVFEPFEQILKNTWDADEIEKANLALKAGTYTIKILDNNGKEVHNMFLGWKNRPEDYKQNEAQELKDPDTFYGAIFTLNDNIYNLKGGNSKSEYGFDVNFYAVAAGENFSLAVVSPKDWVKDGDKPGDKYPEYSVIGWGNNTYGQIGSSKGINDDDSQEEMTLIENAHLSSSVVEDYRDMQAGSNHALFLTKSGDVYSWGGSKDNASVYSVHKVNFKNDPKIVYISAGDEYSSAIDENGNIYAWSPEEGKSSNTINPISGINNSFFSIKQ